MSMGLRKLRPMLASLSGVSIVDAKFEFAERRTTGFLVEVDDTGYATHWGIRDRLWMRVPVPGAMWGLEQDEFDFTTIRARAAVQVAAVAMVGDLLRVHGSYFESDEVPGVDLDAPRRNLVNAAERWFDTAADAIHGAARSEVLGEIELERRRLRSL